MAFAISEVDARKCLMWLFHQPSFSGDRLDQLMDDFSGNFGGTSIEMPCRRAERSVKSYCGKYSATMLWEEMSFGRSISCRAMEFSSKLQTLRFK